MTVTIRRAGPDDAATLADIGEATFRETFLDGFAIPYPPADLAPWMEATYSRDAAAARLADPVGAAWLAEDAAGRAVGYATVGACKLPHPEVADGDWELHQLYLLREAQGGGLGRSLFDTALTWLEARNGGRTWLGVWSGNTKAQDFYARHGFAKVGEYQFPVGTWRDDEFIFRRG